VLRKSQLSARHMLLKKQRDKLRQPLSQRCRRNNKRSSKSNEQLSGKRSKKPDDKVRQLAEDHAAQAAAHQALERAAQAAKHTVVTEPSHPPTSEHRAKPGTPIVMPTEEAAGSAAMTTVTLTSSLGNATAPTAASQTVALSSVSAPSHAHLLSPTRTLSKQRLVESDFAPRMDSRPEATLATPQAVVVSPDRVAPAEATQSREHSDSFEESDSGLIMNPSLSMSAQVFQTQRTLVSGTPVMVMSPAGPVAMFITADGQLVPASQPTAASPWGVPAGPAMVYPVVQSTQVPYSRAPAANQAIASRGSRGLVADPASPEASVTKSDYVTTSDSSGLPTNVKVPQASLPTMTHWDAGTLPGMGDTHHLASGVAMSAGGVEANQAMRRTEHHERGPADPAAAIQAGVIPPGSKLAPPSGQLGSFMFVKNSRFDVAKPSSDNPRYWVGRIAEIMRGGRMRLHWHRETELCSGIYVATNNYFPEKTTSLRPFRSAAFDSSRKAWQLYPVIERITNEAELDPPLVRHAEDDSTGDTGTPSVKPSSVGPETDGDEFAVGSFVFMRNARFKPDSETVEVPRYWVARVTGIPPVPPRQANGKPSAPSVTSKNGIISDDGKLRLQWMKETAVGSNMFGPTSNVFFESFRLCKLVPGGMRLDPVLQVWRRGTDALTPSPLCFPGDESLIMSKILPAEAQRVGGGPLPAELINGISSNPSSKHGFMPSIVCEPVPAVPLVPNAFAFLKNANYRPETSGPTNPRFWIVRVVGLVPDALGIGGPKVRVQWQAETAGESNLFKETSKLFFEVPETLHPLNATFDMSNNAWRIVSNFNEAATFTLDVSSPKTIYVQNPQADGGLPQRVAIAQAGPSVPSHTTTASATSVRPTPPSSEPASTSTASTSSVSAPSPPSAPPAPAPAATAPSSAPHANSSSHDATSSLAHVSDTSQAAGAVSAQTEEPRSGAVIKLLMLAANGVTKSVPDKIFLRVSAIPHAAELTRYTTAIEGDATSIKFSGANFEWQLQLQEQLPAALQLDLWRLADHSEVCTHS
jgi:hypothetical protein